MIPSRLGRKFSARLAGDEVAKRRLLALELAALWVGPIEDVGFWFRVGLVIIILVHDN